MFRLISMDLNNFMVKNFLVSFLFVFFALTGALAQTEAVIFADSFSHGNDLYAKGEYFDAAEDFCRVLLLDETNVNARQRLREISSQSILPVKLKVQLITIESLLAYIDNLKNDISYFSARSASFHRTVDQNNDDLAGRMDPQNQVSGVGRSTVGNLISVLEQKKKSFEVTLKQFKKQYQIARSPIKTPDPFIEMVSAGSQESNGNSEPTKIFEHNVDGKTFEVEKEKSNVVDPEILDLSLKVAEFGLELKRKDGQIEDDQLQLTDLNSRLELGQRLLVEKDDAIMQLKAQNETEISKIIQEKADLEKHYEKEFADLKVKLGTYRDSLMTAHFVIATSEENISNLNSQISELTHNNAVIIKKLKEYALNLGAATKEIAGLKKDHRLQQQKDREVFLNFRKHKLELFGTIDFYKDALGESKGRLLSKTITAASLYEMLMQMHGKLLEKQHDLDTLTSKMQSFEVRLAGMQEKVFDLERGELHEQSDYVKAQIRDMFQDFNQMNTVLLRQTNDVNYKGMMKLLELKLPQISRSIYSAQ